MRRIIGIAKGVTVKKTLWNTANEGSYPGERAYALAYKDHPAEVG